MLIIVLGRVSTEEQGQKGYSLAEQIKSCRARAMEIAQRAAVQPTILEFVDEMSGDFLERPGLQAALEVVRQQKVDYFICLDPDRFSRKLMLQLLITDEIERTGCRLEFVQHEYRNTAEGRLFYQLRGAVAEFEKLKIIERTSRGARGKVRAGGLPHFIRLYGYEFRAGAGRVAASEALVPDPAEAQWVHTVFQWCVHEGLGPGAIATRLNSLGVPTKLGAKWGASQVRELLRREVYATGRLPLGQRDHAGLAIARQLPEEERRKRRISLHAKAKPPDQWLQVKVEPIIPQDLWDQAQAVMDGFRISNPDAYHRPGRYRMLTGLGECGVCGHPLYYNGKTVECHGRHRRAAETGCTLPAKPFPQVEAAVWEQVCAWVREPELLRRAAEGATGNVARATSDHAGIRREIAALEEQIRAKEEEQERTGLLFTRKLWPADKALPALAQIGQELTALHERVAALRGQVKEPAAVRPKNPVLELLEDPEWREEILATLNDLSEPRRVELTRLAIGKYILHPSGRGRPPEVKVYPR